MASGKFIHYSILIVVIIYFSWLNSKPRSNKEGFHPKIKEQYRSGMRNLHKIQEGLTTVKTGALRSLSKKLGY
tara:strand:- start:2236 stop:2454 length:219 start_codon:yes stop_codon:yes gene_type:complete